MSRGLPFLLALALGATGAPVPARAACDDLVGTRYYGPCVDQVRERDAHELEGTRREQQRLQDIERQQQATDERVRELEREQRLERLRPHVPDLH